MASGNFLGNGPQSAKLYVTWSSVANTTANTSDVTVNLYLRHYALYASALNGSYLSVGGNSSNYSKTISYSGSSSTDTLLSTKTVTVKHKSDGSGTCDITATFVLNGKLSGQYVGTITASQTVTLDKIARSSSISKITNASGTKISSINSGSVIRVYWTPAATSYKYRIQCIVSGSTYTFPSSSTYYTPNKTSSHYETITTEHSWIPAKPSDKVIVRLYTYNSSGTQVGEVKTSSFTLNVLSSIIPSISNFTATVVDGKGGYYVQGKSKVRLSVTATQGSGASGISSYIYTGRKLTNPSSTVTTASTITSGILNFAGTETYSADVKDSRGRYTNSPLETTITVYPYSPPTISSITVQRCNSSGIIDPNGTYAYVTVNSSYSPINGANTRTVVLSNSSDNYVAETPFQATSNTDGSYSGIYGGSFAIGSTYTIRATITDTAYSETGYKDAILQTAERPLNIAPNGKAVSIGKLATASSSNGLFEIGWDVSFADGKQISGPVETLEFGKIIPSNANLNNLTTPGIYRSEDGNKSGTLSNIPSGISGGFRLVVRRERNANYITQIITTARTQYIRNYNGSSWASWLRMVLSDSGNFDNEITAGTSISAGTNITSGATIASGTTITAGSSIYTNDKTSQYDGRRGVCTGQNGRIYLCSTPKATGTSGQTAGVMFSNNGTSATSYLIESGVTQQGEGIVTGKGSFNITVGNSSDRRLKTDFKDLSHLEDFYNQLKPCSYRMKDNTNDYHIGFVAQDVEKALIDNDLSKDDFAGLLTIQYEGDLDENSEDKLGRYIDTGIQPGEDTYCLSYNEFIALNTYMIQKLKNENAELKKRLDTIEKVLYQKGED